MRACVDIGGTKVAVSLAADGASLWERSRARWRSLPS